MRPVIGTCEARENRRPLRSWILPTLWARHKTETFTVWRITAKLGRRRALRREAGKRGAGLDKTGTPASWRSSEANQNYEWILKEGESPFPIGIQRGPD
jgi:hypothetical protein